jgi:hypothetical protein
VYAAVAHVHTIDDGIPKWSVTLDDSPAHERDIVIRQRSFKGLVLRAVDRGHFEPDGRTFLRGI